MPRFMDSQVDDNDMGVPYAAAFIVLGSLALLILIRRGFRGVSVGGVGVSVK